MKLLAATYGTEGDTRPIAAVCRALIDAGHEVHLLADAGTLGSAKALSVPHAALAGDMRQELAPVIAAGQGANAAAALANIANTHTMEWTRQVAEAARGCDALVVSGLASFVGLSVAEHLGKPLIGAGMIPLSPTRDFASPFLPPDVLPRVFHRLSHHLISGLLWRSFRKATNQARERVLGMGPRKKLWVGHPMLYGISPSLLPRPGDWPDNAQVCGQWLAPTKAWTPPPSLQSFLDAGEAPIYAGFGSMVGFDRDAVLRALIDAAGGQRVLLYPGWAGLPELLLPDNFFVIGDTPHDWLFPRTSLVIHHGGSGTSHSACRAGVPSVVMPFAGDQPFWASLLRRAGVADRAISPKSLNADALRTALAFAQRAGTKQRARALGERMLHQNGTATAVGHIEALLAA
jgi:UDP:flavonoid glycosyltransferase YjiC (YdhE family)